MSNFNCEKINSSLNCLKEGLDPKIEYMNSISNDIKSLERALKSYDAVMKPVVFLLDKYQEGEKVYFDYLAWSSVLKRLIFVRELYDNDVFTKILERNLMEMPFESREKAHKNLPAFLLSIS